MKISNLKPQHQYSIIGQTISLNNQIEYHNTEIKPFLNDMAAWEAKEYKTVNDNNIKSLNEKIEYMMGNESFFNNELSTYNLSVAGFVAKNLNNRN